MRSVELRHDGPHQLFVSCRQKGVAQPPSIGVILHSGHLLSLYAPVHGTDRAEGSVEAIGAANDPGAGDGAATTARQRAF
jgi:hypothetical protein